MTEDRHLVGRRGSAKRWKQLQHRTFTLIQTRQLPSDFVLYRLWSIRIRQRDCLCRVRSRTQRMGTHVRNSRSLRNRPGRRSTGWRRRGIRRFHHDEALADLTGRAALADAVRTRPEDRISDASHCSLVGVEQREHTLSAGQSPTRDGPPVRISEGLNRRHEEIGHTRTRASPALTRCWTGNRLNVEAELHHVPTCRAVVEFARLPTAPSARLP